MGMASASAARAGDGAAARIRKAATALASDNQPLIADIRKTIHTMKEIAVEMEKLNRAQEVKQLENAVLELLDAAEECTCFYNVLQSVGNNYEHGPQLTNFKKLFEDEASKIKRGFSSNHQNHNLLRQFREAVWNVHHAGQPMPGEEQEDVVMTSTEVGLLNTVCPISGKSVTELSDPVRSMDCKHIYDKKAIGHYMKNSMKCPVAGCPKMLRANRVVCDPLLPVEIEEFRAVSKETVQADFIEDFTALDEED